MLRMRKEMKLYRKAHRSLITFSVFQKENLARSSSKNMNKSHSQTEEVLTKMCLDINVDITL